MYFIWYKVYSSKSPVPSSKMLFPIFNIKKPAKSPTTKKVKYLPSPDLAPLSKKRILLPAPLAA